MTGANGNGNGKVLGPWVDGLRVGSTATARAYAFVVGRFLESADKGIAEITVGDALLYVGELSRSGLARASVAHHISAVRSFLRHCQGLGLIPMSPLDALRRPRVSITSANRYLTKRECERLLRGARAVSWGCYLATAVMLYTGLRVNELCQAEWRHLYRDPDGRLGLLVVNGKGGKERFVAVQTPLWKLIQEDRKHRGLSARLNARDRAPLVARPRTGTRYDQPNVWRLLRRAATVAGLDKPLSPHWLRHSFGTLAAHAGATAFELQRDMGHAQITTSQRYVHMSIGLRDSAANKVHLRLPAGEGR